MRSYLQVFSLAKSYVMGSRDGKLVGSLVAARHEGDGVHAIDKAANFCLCLNSTSRGGSAVLADKMPTGVTVK